MCCKFSISPLTEFVGPTGSRDTQHGGLDFWLDKEMWSFEAVGRCFHGWRHISQTAQNKTAKVSCEFETNNDILIIFSFVKNLKFHILRQFMSTKRSGCDFRSQISTIPQHVLSFCFPACGSGTNLEIGPTFVNGCAFHGKMQLGMHHSRGWEIRKIPGIYLYLPGKNMDVYIYMCIYKIDNYTLLRDVYTYIYI